MRGIGYFFPALLLLAVSILVSSVIGASIAYEAIRDSDSILKRQFSLGANGSWSNGRFNGLNVEGAWKNRNGGLSGSLGLDSKGRLGGSLGGSYTWGNGRHNLGGSVGYQPGGGLSGRLGYTFNFRRK